MLFTPPHQTPIEHGSLRNSKTSSSDSGSNRDTPKPVNHRQSDIPRDRDHLVNETPSGTQVVPLPRGESTATTVYISPSASTSDSESSTDVKLKRHQSSKPLPSQRTIASRPSRSTLAGSRIPVPPHRKKSRHPKQDTHSSPPKPSWRAPAAGETIFPRGRQSLLNQTTPRRVSRSADMGMLRNIHGKKTKRRSRLRSSSIGVPSRRDMTTQINPRESVANWLRNTRTGWWSSEEATDYLVPSLTDKSCSDKRNFVLQPVISPEQRRVVRNNERPSSSPSPEPVSSLHSTHEIGLYGAQTTQLRGGALPTASPLFGKVTESFLSPLIQDQGNWKWVVCLPTTEEETWLVDFEAQVYLKIHPEGGHTLDVPGLPQQAGEVQGEYNITLEEPEFSATSSDDISVLEKVQIVDDPDTLRFLRNGETHGTFSIDEGFSLRFLTLERNRWLTAEQFDVEFTVEQSYEVGKGGDLTISHGLVCTIYPGPFMWWAVEATFTLFVHESPWNRTLSLQIAGDYTLDMGIGSGYSLDNESRITVSKSVSELLKPIKMTWKQRCGSLSTIVVPSVSNRSCIAKHSQRRRQLHGPDMPLVESDIALDGQPKQCGVSATLGSNDLDFQNNTGIHSPIQCLKDESPPPTQSLTIQAPRKNDHATLNYRSVVNKINQRSSLKVWLLDALKACLVFSLGVALFHLVTPQAPDFKAAISTYSTRMANSSGPGSRWQWDEWEAYLKNEWGIELVDIKGDPTGWKTLMGVGTDDGAGKSDDEATETGEIVVALQEEEDGGGSDRTEEVAESEGWDVIESLIFGKSETKVEVNRPVDTDDADDRGRGRLSKVRDAVDYALGWRPLD
ncbi:MAG: hypothetical protein Q9160_001396 [Pyrenula sp. 1 TL-2023]